MYIFYNIYLHIMYNLIKDNTNLVTLSIDIL